ncbi:MAG: TonB-dependent receptor [Rhodospirillaceae bacterium]|nr:TonB-dependent receptor [Rhodospirillaceae bacterium]
MTRKSRLAVGVSAAALSVALAMPTVAQPVLEEIVVTARKREESLQEIPIAISAFSADQLDRAGITKLEDLTLQVAGVQYHSLGLAIPGRVNSSIRFRGMDVNSQVPTFQLGTLFVDGIYVLGGTHSIPLDDVARVEVVKGPQSAYFGRNTFGGAINYISKEPSMTEYAAELNALGATYDEYDVSGAFSGPLVEDKVAFRVGGRLFSTGGMWTASDGGKLGEQSTKTVQASVKVTPNDAFTAKARVFFGRDEDGPAAGGAIPGRLNDSCSGKTVTNPAGASVRPALWFCGKVPEEGQAISTLRNNKIIDSNTTVRSPRALISTGDPNWLLTNVIQRPQPARLQGKVPTLEGIELEREVFRVSGNLSYEFASGIVAEAQGGYNTLKANWVRDFNFTAFDNAYSRDPQDTQDFSVEARVSSAQDQKLRWLAGVNYYEQDFVSAGTGGDAVFLCIDDTPGLTIGNCRVPPAANTFAFFPNALANTDHVETLGVFAAVSYDFTDQLTLNLEGRYQDDSFQRGLTTFQTIKGDKFLPRAILQFKPNDDTNLYVSYAKGLLQGELNQLVIDSDARERAQFDALNSPGSVPEEILDSYEIGWKQQFMDNRVSINTAAYYGDWANKKIRNIVQINFTCGDFPVTIGTTGCRPNLGEGNVGQPARFSDGTPVLNNTNVVSAFDVKIWGAEFEGNAAITEQFVMGGSLTYARSEVKSGFFSTIGPIAGSTSIKGAANPRFPKWSGSVNGTYTAQLTQDWEWFIRGDLSYFGKAFVELDNLAFCDSYFLANSRIGVEKDGFRLEAFVKNLLNDDSWTACSRFLEFDLPNDANPNVYQSVIVAPQLKRQFGIKTSLKF